MYRQDISTLRQQFGSYFQEYHREIAVLRYNNLPITEELELLALKINRLAENLLQCDPKFPTSWKPL